MKHKLPAIGSTQRQVNLYSSFKSNETKWMIVSSTLLSKSLNYSNEQHTLRQLVMSHLLQ